jgi:glycosyltransferase involved in cell wall biosynthesis
MVVCRLFRNVYHFHTNHDPAIIMNAPSQKMLKSFSEVIVFKYSNHIVAETSTVKKQLMCRFKIPSRKITIIPMGVEESVLVQNAFDSSKTVVLCVGRIIPRKNQLTLIKAIPYVLAKHDKVKFIFAGPIEDKIYFQKIMGFIKEKNISKFVEFTGEISQEKLNALYREATIFAFPTLAETQGIVLLEAMSYGLPIVVSKIGPIMDITSGLQNSALLVNQESQCFAESINRLLSDNALRFELSSNARKLASAYSWDAVATRVLELYARLVIFNEKNSRNNV